MQHGSAVTLLHRSATALLTAVLSLLGLCALAAPASASTVATTTVVTSSANPATVAQTVTFTAVVDYSPGHSVPGGYVDFAVPGTYMFLYSAQQEALACNQVPIENGVATCEVAGGWELAGADTVSAQYLGSTGYATSSGTLAETVQNTATQFATSTSVTSSVNPAVAGQRVTLTAHVGWNNVIGSNPSEGTVDFIMQQSPFLPYTGSYGEIEALGCSSVPVVEGTATCYTYGWEDAGTQLVAAAYSGTASAQSSVGDLDETVGQASTTLTLNASLVSPPATGEQVTFTATVNAVSPSLYDFDGGIVSIVLGYLPNNVVGAAGTGWTAAPAGAAVVANCAATASPLDSLSNYEPFASLVAGYAYHGSQSESVSCSLPGGYNPNPLGGGFTVSATAEFSGDANYSSSISNTVYLPT